MGAQELQTAAPIRRGVAKVIDAGVCSVFSFFVLREYAFLLAGLLVLFCDLIPGGSLGKQLYLKVSDIYKHNEAPIVHASSTLRDVIVEISSKRLGCAAVIDDKQALLGIITDGDLRRMLERTTDITRVKASDIMTVSPKTIQKEEYAVKALHLMQKNDITQLVVMEEEKVAGFIHIHDLLREGII